MPATVSRSPKSAQLQDPLGALAVAIESVLEARSGKKQAGNRSMSIRVSQALHEVLEAQTPQSRSTRILLIRHLVDIESQQLGIETTGQFSGSNDLLTTAQAAQLLGYSRPYVAMLIDQKKLTGATVSSGGHRRVPRSAVLAWKEKHLGVLNSGELQSEGQTIGAYKSTEEDVLRRMKALSKGSKKV